MFRPICARLKEALKSNKPLLDVAMKSAAHISDVRHLLAHFYPLESEDGENRSTGMVMVDITERKITEAALRLVEARYRDVVEHSIFGVYSVSSNGFARRTLRGTLGVRFGRRYGCKNAGKNIRSLFHYQGKPGKEPGSGFRRCVEL